MHRHYMLQNLTFTIYLPLLVSFMLSSYIFMRLISVPLLPIREISLAFFIRKGLVMIKSLNFHLFRDAFISLSFLRDSFTGYRILG